MGCCTSKGEEVGRADGSHDKTRITADACKANGSGGNRNAWWDTENFVSPTANYRMSLRGYRSPTEGLLSSSPKKRSPRSFGLSKKDGKDKEPNGHVNYQKEAGIDEDDVEIDIYPLDQFDEDTMLSITQSPTIPVKLKNLRLSCLFEGITPEVKDRMSQVFMGNLNTTLPTPSRTFRIFVSSEFSDSRVERNALMHRVYPRLRHACREQGYDFELIDLHWGVMGSTTNNHVFRELCMKELQRCENISIGPCFLSLSHQKYGASLLPTKIPANDFELLLLHIEDDEDKSLFNKWYVRDDNAVPSEYVLQPISTHFAGFAVASEKEARLEALKEWNEEDLTLRYLLHSAADKTFENGEARRFHLSASEEELQRGIINSDDPASSAVWFHRKITDLHDNIHSETADQFIDIIHLPLKIRQEGIKEIDQSRQDMLETIQLSAMEKLEKANTFNYALTWSEKGIDPSIPEHSQYIQTICQDFYTAMKQKFEQVISMRNDLCMNDPLYEEVLQHLTFGQLKCQNFHGREDTLVLLKNYIDGECKSPCVVYGMSGSGKASVLSLVAKMTHVWLKKDAAVIIRFSGTTADSSNVRLLLRSLCQQIAIIYGKDPSNIPQDYTALSSKFKELLSLASPTKPMVIFLDSLDQLSYSHNSRQLSWLPRSLPDHVRLIVSTLDEDHLECFQVLKEVISEDDCFIEVPALSEEVAKNILSAWLVHEDRKLTKEQEQIVLQAFSKCPTPLFLKLVFEEALTWKSYSPLESLALGKSVRKVINSIFERLEEKHGKMIVHRALGYITASEFGLSEAELIDILSCDCEVTDDVFQVGSTHRLPQLLLAQIRADIEPFLVEHLSDGVRTVSWFYRQFYEVASERYLHSQSRELETVHSMLGVYFAGKLSPNKDEENNKRKSHFYLQPTQFNVDKFNLRKLSQLPRHLVLAKSFENLKQEALCNYDFLQAKLKAFSLHAILDDFSLALASNPADADLKSLREVFHLSSEALEISSDQLPSQLIGRLLALCHPSVHIKKLIQQAQYPLITSFIPNSPCLLPPGGRLLHTISDVEDCIDISSDGSFMVTVSSTDMLKIWELRTGKVIKTFEVVSDVNSISFCRGDQCVLVSNGHVIQLWNIDSEGNEFEYESKKHVVHFDQTGEDVLVIVLGSVIKVFDTSAGELVRHYEDGGFVHNQVACWRGYATFANSSERYLRVFELETGSILHSFEAYSEPTDCVSWLGMSSYCDGQILTCSFQTGEVKIFSLMNGQCLQTLGQEINNPSICLDGRYILYSGHENEINAWDLETGVRYERLLKNPVTSPISYVASKDYKLVVTISDDKTARVWDLDKDDTSKYSFQENRGDHSVQDMFLVKSDQQRQVVTKSKTSGPISVWNLNTCQVMRTLHGACADELFIVTDTRAVVRSAGRLALIDLQAGSLITKLRPSCPEPTSGKRVKRRASSLYKKRDLATRLAESSHVDVSKSSKFSDCSLAGTDHVVSLSKNRMCLKLSSLETGQLVAKLRAGQKECIETLIVSGNGRVAVCACEKSSMLVWDLVKQKLRHTLQLDGKFPEFGTAAITYDGGHLIDVMKVDKSKQVAVTWDLTSGKVKHTGDEHANIWAVAISSESMRIVLSSSSSTELQLSIHDMVTGKLRHKLEGHTEPVRGIAFSKTGHRAVTYVPLGSKDRSIRLWDIQSGNLLAIFTPDLSPSCCLITDDGDQVVMVINKSRPVVSLSVSHQLGSREVSVDIDNPYYNPKLTGAVFDLSDVIKWDEEGEGDSDDDE